MATLLPTDQAPPFAGRVLGSDPGIERDVLKVRYRALAAAMILHAYDDLRRERPLGAKPERATAVKRSAAKFLLSRRCRKLCRILGADYGRVRQEVRRTTRT